jgi:hypothetical protein
MSCQLFRESFRHVLRRFEVESAVEKRTVFTPVFIPPIYRSQLQRRPQRQTTRRRWTPQRRRTQRPCLPSWTSPTWRTTRPRRRTRTTATRERGRGRGPIRATVEPHVADQALRREEEAGEGGGRLRGRERGRRGHRRPRAKR